MCLKMERIPIGGTLIPWIQFAIVTLRLTQVLHAKRVMQYLSILCLLQIKTGGYIYLVYPKLMSNTHSTRCYVNTLFFDVSTHFVLSTSFLVRGRIFTYENPSKWFLIKCLTNSWNNTDILNSLFLLAVIANNN